MALPTKVPITINVVRAMLNALPDGLLGQRDRALLLLGFAGGFDRSELIELDVADVQFTAASAIITLRSCKTGQKGQGAKRVIPKSKQASICPVVALKTWLASASITHGAVFRAFASHRFITSDRLSTHDVARIVVHAARTAGVALRDLSGYNLCFDLPSIPTAPAQNKQMTTQRIDPHPKQLVRSGMQERLLSRENAVSGGELNREDWRAIWRGMSRQYGWSLVDDEERFLDQVLIEFDRLEDSRSMSRLQPRWALLGAYSALLYGGLCQHSEDAASELWWMMFRYAVKDGCSEAAAGDIAQEATLRVLDILGRLRSPQSLFSVAFRIVRTVKRECTKYEGYETRHSIELADKPVEMIDPVETAAVVEERVLGETLVNALRAALPNDLERLVLIRKLIFGENWRNVARDLGLSSARVRLAGHRALGRLRKDPGFMKLLVDLSNGAK